MDNNKTVAQEAEVVEETVSPDEAVVETTTQTPTVEEVVTSELLVKKCGVCNGEGLETEKKLCASCGGTGKVN